MNRTGGIDYGGTLLQTVLNMSFTGSIVIFVVLFARVALLKAPKIFSYMLWGIVLFRLLCPVSFFTNISVLKFIDISAKHIEKTGQQVQGTIKNQETKLEKSKSQTENLNTESNIQNNIDKKEDITRNPYNTFLFYGTIIWLAGIIIILIYNSVAFLRLKKRLLAAVPLKGQVLICDYITQPFVFGIFNPKIYLPSSITAAEQEYIILHEQIHIRRRDYLFKLLAFAALMIHWFNPLVWLAFNLSEKDMEMSCDEAVMKKAGSSIKTEYSASLLKLASGRKTFIKSIAAFGESETGSRIKHIMNYKKPAKAVTIMAVIILAAVFVFTGGIQAGQNPGKNSSKNIKNPSSGNASNSKGITRNQAANANKTPVTSAKPLKWWEFWEEGSYIHTMDCAFLREMTEDTIIADPIEYIDSDNTKRIKELGLDRETDLITGYYYYNPDKNTTIWKIDENTEFMFLDWGGNLKDNKNVIDTYNYGNSQHPLTYTKDKELFRKYLDTYKTSKNKKPLIKFPFFFEIENGVVKKVVEKFFI